MTGERPGTGALRSSGDWRQRFCRVRGRLCGRWRRTWGNCTGSQSRSGCGATAAWPPCRTRRTGTPPPVLGTWRSAAGTAATAAAWLYSSSSLPGPEHTRTEPRIQHWIDQNLRWRCAHKLQPSSINCSDHGHCPLRHASMHVIDARSRYERQWVGCRELTFASLEPPRASWPPSPPGASNARGPPCTCPLPGSPARKHRGSDGCAAVAGRLIGAHGLQRQGGRPLPLLWCAPKAMRSLPPPGPPGGMGCMPGGPMPPAMGPL